MVNEICLYVLNICFIIGRCFIVGGDGDSFGLVWISYREKIGYY